MADVEFGLMLRQNDPGHSLREVIEYNRGCIQALTSGFTTLWLEDHLQVGTVDALECLTTLSYLAALYPQLKVGTLVLAQSYRNPALVAKMAANLHSLSGGRMILGLGAGWKEDEYLSYGYAYPAVKTRIEQLEEAVQIIRALWSQESVSFEGRYYRVQEASCAPQPSPAIPILIGGGGERRTLSLVARYADWWNFNSCPIEVYTRKLSFLKQHCERIGRDPSKIKLTYLSTISVAEDPAQVRRHPGKHYIAGNAAEVAREIEQFHKVGVKHFMFRFLDLPTLEHFVARVVPKFL